LIERINDAVELLDPSDDRSEPFTSGDTWRGVIHADANSLGRIFLHFGTVTEALGSRSDEAYAAELAAFSKAVEDATWSALQAALREMLDALGRSSEKFIVYPLIVGGDDVTAVTDGRWALYLAQRYLRHFEEKTGADPAIARVMTAAQKVFGDGPADRIHACAGVAIVKHHFPFSLAYQLAESLCSEAKGSIRNAPGSAVDWHAVMDASPPGLAEIRRRLTSGADGDSVVVTRRPYRLDEFEQLVEAARLLAAESEDGEGPVLPSGAMHDLRQALFVGRAEAQSRLNAVVARTGRAASNNLARQHFDAVLSLVGANNALVDDQYRTGFVDALDGIQFLRGWIA